MTTSPNPSYRPGHDPTESHGEPSEILGFVGLGASAGGLTALERVLQDFPGQTGLVVLIAQHLSAEQPSILSELLGRHSAIAVVEAFDGIPLQADHAYAIPPDGLMWIEGGQIRIAKPHRGRDRLRTIDHLFRSIARQSGLITAGVILSGTGTDGTSGLLAIRAAGGLAIVQDPETAEHRGMPESAIQDGAADQVLAPEAIGSALRDFARNPLIRAVEDPSVECQNNSSVDESVLVQIGYLLRERERFEIETYKPETLRRRITRRAGMAGLTDPSSYVDLLRERSEERRQLIRDFLIGVTEFFREPESFTVLEREAIDPLLERTGGDQTLRIWIAGCSTGEEAYSLTILLLEARRQAGRESDLDLQIFATDIDQEALRTARRGIYDAESVAAIRPEWLRRYFDPIDGQGYQIRPTVRDRISFAIQDLCSDPPFPRTDLISCRNVLIYFRSEVQQRVVSGFGFALRPEGYLWLGSSESLPRDERAFQTLSSSWRLYQKVGQSMPQLPQPLRLPAGGSGHARFSASSASPTQLAQQILMEDCLPPSLIVDGRDRAIYLHGDLEPYLRLPEGEPNPDGLAMIRPPYQIRVRSAVQEARRESQVVAVEAITNGSGPRTRIVVRPTRRESLGVDAVSITFEAWPEPSMLDSNQGDRDREDDGRSSSRIEQLERELHATRIDLQNTVVELERRNAELRMIEQENITHTEEMRSANEELQASSEELRSLNEELTIVNAQLKEKITEVHAAHDDLTNLFHSTRVAAVILDLDLRVQRYTPTAADLLHLGEGFIGRPISELDSPLVDDELIGQAHEVLDDFNVRERSLSTESGRWYRRLVLPYRTVDRRVEGAVVTWTDLTDLHAANQQVRLRVEQQAALVRLGLQALAIEDLDDLLRLTVRTVAQVLDVEFAKVLQWDPSRRAFLLRAAVGFAPSLVGTAWISGELDSQAGYTLSQDAPVIVEDHARERRFSGPPMLHDHGIVSGLSCTIGTSSGPHDLSGRISGNGQPPFGVLGAHTSRRRQFTVEDADFLQAVANLIAYAVQREQARDWLRQGEAQFRRALDEAPLPTVLMTRDGQILLVNRAWCEITGYSPEELPNISAWTALAYGEGSGPVREGINQLFHREGPIDEGEFQIRTKSGDHRIWNFHTTPIGTLRDGREALISMALDVTQRNQTMETLTLREEQFRMATQAARVGIWNHDYRANRFQALGQAAEILGAVDGVVTDEAFRRMVPPQDMKLVEDHVQRACDPQGDGRIDFQHRVVFPDGTTHWVAVSGQVQFESDAQGRRSASTATGTLIDVTDRVRADRARRRSETRLRTFIDASPDDIYARDDQGRLILANRGYLDALGIRREALPQIIDDPRLTPDQHRREYEFDALVLSDGQSRSYEESRDHDGRQHLVTKFPLLDENEMAVAVCSIVADITPQKAIEDDLMAMDRRKNEFLAMLAHELRNPLSAIIGALELIHVETEDPDPSDVIDPADTTSASTSPKSIDPWALTILDRQSRQMRRLVDDLMDVSRVSRGKIQLQTRPLRLDQAIRDVADELAEAIAERRHDLRIELGSRTAWIQGDPHRVHQILINLLGNAIKYTGPGGQIILTLQSLTNPPVHRLSVRDTGIGIDPEMLPQIFEIFSQADLRDHRQSGLGIGLALVRSLVQLHGGRIEAHSDGLGHGSEFRLDLPSIANPTADALRDAPGHDARAESDRVDEGVPSSSKHILLVDDNRDLAYTLAELLRRQGHHVDLAHLVDEAVTRYQEDRHEVVLLDLDLPDGNGFDVAREIQSLSDPEGDRPKLIAISGYGQARDIARTRKAGIDEHLVKPVDAEEIRRVLARSDQGPRSGEPGPSVSIDPQHVLVIDDQLYFTYLTQKMLDRYGFNVDTASTAREGIALAQARRPGVILCDLGLGPEMDGLSLARQLRRLPELVETRLIAISGRDHERDHRAAREAGFERLLVKPVDYKRLAEILRSPSQDNAH